MRNIFIVAIISFLLKPFISKINNLSDDECVSIGPSGVSGFWEILPKVRKITNNKKILCASSGCLAGITRDFDIHYIYNIANFLKYENISYEMKKNEFIKIIAKKVRKIPDITIITMDILGNCYKNVAQNKTHLIQLLIETSDIPYFTTRNPGKKIDGGFCFYLLDNCKTKIRHSLTPKVLLNLFNFNLTKLEVMELYNYNI